MTGWFGPKLKSGETLLLRVPVFPLWYPTLMMMAGSLLALPAAWHLVAGSGEIVSQVVLAATGFFMFVVAVWVVIGASRTWKLLVTDRRLLERKSRERYEETPFAEIDAVTPYRLGDGLFVTAGGRQFVIPCKRKTAERILAAIEGAA